MVVVTNPSEGKPSIGKSIRNCGVVTGIGLDLAKNAFQVHAIDGQGEVVMARKLTRGRLRSSPNCRAASLAHPARRSGLTKFNSPIERGSLYIQKEYARFVRGVRKRSVTVAGGAFVAALPGRRKSFASVAAQLKRRVARSFRRNPLKRLIPRPDFPSPLAGEGGCPNGGRMSICDGSQAWRGSQSRSLAMRVLARTMSFRMAAVRATLAFLPLAIIRW